jgi:dihydroflavonol-4-reductase
MKVLVTGATGFIGSYLTEALLRRGHEVTCLVRRHSDRRWIEHLDLDFIECDLSDVKSCADRLDGFHYVYHLAGRTKAVSETDFFRANADGTLSLLNALAAAGPPLKRFVYVSSLPASGM